MQNTVSYVQRPSKTFNIAGLQVSNIFIPNDSLRRRFIKEIDRAGYSQLNTMGIVGCEGAYKVGAPWLDELKEYIQDNIQFTIDYVAKIYAENPRISSRRHISYVVRLLQVAIKP